MAQHQLPPPGRRERRRGEERAGSRAAGTDKAVKPRDIGGGQRVATEKQTTGREQWINGATESAGALVRNIDALSTRTAPDAVGALYAPHCSDYDPRLIAPG